MLGQREVETPPFNSCERKESLNVKIYRKTYFAGRSAFDTGNYDLFYIDQSGAI